MIHEELMRTENCAAQMRSLSFESWPVKCRSDSQAGARRKIEETRQQVVDIE